MNLDECRPVLISVVSRCVLIDGNPIYFLGTHYLLDESTMDLVTFEN